MFSSFALPSFGRILFFLLLSLSVRAQTDHWESIILPGDNFNYLIPNTELPSNWNAINFDDNVWDTGLTGIGYGDDDDQTVIETTASLYLRKSFTINDLNIIEEAILHMDYDDSFVAYLNGTEIARAYISGSPPAFDQLSDDFHEALLYQGLIPDNFTIEKSLLIEGENILAIQVHNQSLSSSDLTAIPVLSVGINVTGEYYSPTPEWFQAQIEFLSSNLPIIFINTIEGQEIPDEPKISADMQIIYRGAGERTFVSDRDNTAFIDFNSKIEIEVRGSSSQALPKKQYSLTTYDVTGEDKDNVELLGMPKENDWILNGLAFDPSLMRDFISYNISRKIGEYASRTQYCELVLNGQYNGLYVLQEKMKKDDNRIDITPVGDNVDGDITGGYITKSDKIDANDPLAWSMPNYGGYETSFIHEEPKPEEVTADQENYIKGQFEALQNTVNQPANASKIDGYPSIIDIPSFLNFIILNELASNVDAYEFSTYFHKDKRGKLRAGPLWDFNLTFGNDLFLWGFDRSHTDVWQFDDGGNMGAKFWKDLFDASDFRCYLAKRWNELRAEGQALHEDSLIAMIEQTDLLIAEATEREQQRWNTVADHAENVAAMKSWVLERLTWMDANMGGFSACQDIETPELVISKISYNPLSEAFGDMSEQEFIEITNNGNTDVVLSGFYFGATGFIYQFPAKIALKAGKHLWLANDSITFKAKYNQSPFGEFTRSLSNGGERLLLLDAFGNTIDDVFYDDSAPWPTAADGEGLFLQLKDLSSDNNDGSNWEAVMDTLQIIEEDILAISSNFDPSLSIYPNPSTDNYQIVSTKSISKITLIDIQGKLFIEEKISSKDYQLKATKLKQGIYVLILEFDDQTVKHIRLLKR